MYLFVWFKNKFDTILPAWGAEHLFATQWVILINRNRSIEYLDSILVTCASVFKIEIIKYLH